MGAQQPTFKPGGGVETWRRNTSFSAKDSKSSPENTESTAPILLGSGGSARYEMLLERLPYLTLILRRPQFSSVSQSVTIREIQKITSVGGNSISQASGEAEDDDNDEQDSVPLGEHEQWSTDKPAAGTPRKKRRLNFKSKETEQESSALSLSGLVDKGASLILSDDDIED